MDQVGRFVDECCLIGQGEVKGSDLYVAYQKWAENCGEHAMKGKVFGERIQESKSLLNGGVIREERSYANVYVGISLRDNAGSSETTGGWYRGVSGRTPRRAIWPMYGNCLHTVHPKSALATEDVQNTGDHRQEIETGVLFQVEARFARPAQSAPFGRSLHSNHPGGGVC